MYKTINGDIVQKKVLKDYGVYFKHQSTNYQCITLFNHAISLYISNIYQSLCNFIKLI